MEVVLGLVVIILFFFIIDEMSELSGLSSKNAPIYFWKTPKQHAIEKIDMEIWGNKKGVNKDWGFEFSGMVVRLLPDGELIMERAMRKAIEDYDVCIAYLRGELNLREYVKKNKDET